MYKSDAESEIWEYSRSGSGDVNRKIISVDFIVVYKVEYGRTLGGSTNWENSVTRGEGFGNT